MTAQEAIEKRNSRRNYTPEKIKLDSIMILDGIINEYNRKAGLHIQLIQNQPRAFSNLTKSYGMFKGVYNVMVGKNSDKNAMEKIGYYGEKIVLEATILGLGTCWVGGTYDKETVQCGLSDNEKIFCVIIVGNIKQDKGFTEKIMYKAIHRKTKNIEELYVSDEGENIPEWFLTGMKAVQKAPSALNKQPVVFLYKKGLVFARTEPEDKNIDLGIAKLHFEIGSGGGTWEWGTEGVFIKSV
jgi:hypothetical protein